MVKDLFVEIDGSRLHYAKTGHGNKHLMIFHGFGQDMHVFEHLTQTLAKHYTFYIFDLYFHGRSIWAHDETPLEKKEWHRTIEIFLNQNGIERFSLSAYSMGGKFVLATLEHFAKQIDEVFLIAPDGIKTSFWYSMATYPVLLRNFFRSMILHPNRFETLTSWLRKSSLVDKGLLKFAEYQMNSEEKRKRVYYSWVVFRKLTFDLDSLARIINENNITFKLIVGKYDKVISPASMRFFLKKLKNPVLIELESGHTGLINQSIAHFVE